MQDFHLLEKKTLVELRELAKSIGIKNVTMKKQELITIITNTKSTNNTPVKSEVKRRGRPAKVTLQATEPEQQSNVGTDNSGDTANIVEKSTPPIKKDSHKNSETTAKPAPLAKTETKEQTKVADATIKITKVESATTTNAPNISGSGDSKNTTQKRRPRFRLNKNETPFILWRR